MNKESRHEFPSKNQKANSAEKDKENYQEIKEEILEAEHQEMIEQEESSEKSEDVDLEQELDSEDIEQETENDEESEDSESFENEQETDDGEIKFDHWLHSSTPVSARSSRNSFSKLERTNMSNSSSLESSVAFAPRIKESREGKNYSGGKYDSNKYSADSTKKYAEQTPGKDSEFSSSSENSSQGK